MVTVLFVFVESKGYLTFLLKPATVPYFEPLESRSHLYTAFLQTSCQFYPPIYAYGRAVIATRLRAGRLGF